MGARPQVLQVVNLGRIGFRTDNWIIDSLYRRAARTPAKAEDTPSRFYIAQPPLQLLVRYLQLS